MFLVLLPRQRKCWKVERLFRASQHSRWTYSLPEIFLQWILMIVVVVYENLLKLQTHISLQKRQILHLSDCYQGRFWS